MNNMVIDTSLSNGASSPAITQKSSATYSAGQTVTQTLVLKAGQQFASSVGFSVMSLTPSGVVQLTASRGANNTYINQAVNQQATIDDTVDAFQITNSGTATVSVGLTFSVAIGAVPPIIGIVLSVNGKTGIVTLSAADIPGLAAVAKSGSYNDLLNKPPGYSLPVATPTLLGGVKPNIGLSVDVNGVLNVRASTINALGGVRIGSNIAVDANGIISVAAPYVLPTATALVLGGVKQGNNVTISPDGTISVDDGYVLPVATATRLGGVKQGPNVTIAEDGTLSVANLPIASTTVLGGVKQGTGITIDANGVISANVRTVAGRVGDVVLAVGDVTDAASASALAGMGGAGLVGFGATTVSGALNTLNARLSTTLINIELVCEEANQLVYAVPGGYPIGLTDLYAMGAHLTSGSDYSGLDGTTLTLTPATAANIPVGAHLLLRCNGSFNVANAVDLATLGGTNGANLVGYGSQTVKQALDGISNNTDVAQGGALVGFADPVAPAYLKTVSDVLNGNEVSIARFMSALQVSQAKAYSASFDMTQNMNDAVSSGVKHLMFFPGKYNFNNVPLASGLSMYSQASLHSTGILPNNVLFNLNANGVLFYTPGTVSGIKMQGFTLSTDPAITVGNSRGIWLGKDTTQGLALLPFPAYAGLVNHSANRVDLSRIVFSTFNQEALFAEQAAAPYVDAIFTQNCLIDVEGTYLTQQRAAVTMYSNDSIVTRCEFASRPGANNRQVTSPNLFCAAFGFFGGQSRALSFISDCVGELSDIGMVFDQKGVGASNIRCDQNNGPGLVLRSTQATVNGLRIWNNSWDTDNLYDGCVIETTARGAVVNGWRSNTESQPNRMRYAIRDDVTTSVDPSNKSVIGPGSSTNIGTQPIFQTGSSSGGAVYAYGGRMTFVDGVTTPSVTNYVSWRTLNTATTQYTNFLNGTNGMCIDIFCNDNFSWLMPGATLRTRTNQPFKMRPQGVYRLTCDTGIWTAHDVAGDVTDSMSSTTWKPIIRILPPVADVVLSGAQTLDGVQTIQGDLCLLVNQTNAVQNGPWVIQNAAWIRPTWWPTGGVTQAFVNVIFFVYDGLLNANSEWRMNTTGVTTIDTSPITIVPLRAARLTTNQASPTAWADIAASVVARASIRMRGGVAPTTPNEGDMWNDNTNLKMDISGTVYTMAKLLSASANLTFPATAAGLTSDLTVTITGAALGDEVTLGVPQTAMTTGGIYSAWVSAANTVTVRFNNTTAASVTPAAASTFRVSVIKR